MHWWVTDLWNSGSHGRVVLISWLFWVIFSITLHELAHGWSAIRAGDRTPIETGHMTWNPWVHMGPMSLIMLALFGFCWGLMPVSPSRFRGRYDEAIVAGSGPAMNLGLGLACALLAAVWVRVAPGLSPSDDVFKVVWKFLMVGVSVNLFAVIFNMLPIPPLDGSRILGNFVPAFERFASDPRYAVVLIVLFIVVTRQASGSLSILAMRWGLSVTEFFVRLLGGGVPAA